MNKELTGSKNLILINSKIPKVWFLAPDTDAPAGGINQFYRLCQIFEEMNITARVLSQKPYTFLDPKELQQYWFEAPQKPTHDLGRFDIPEIESGDLIIYPELFRIKGIFSKPVRSITYIQNWAMTCPFTWQRHYWTYSNSVNLTFSINNIMRSSPCTTILMGLACQTKEFLNTFQEEPKIDFSIVSPYFDIAKYAFDPVKPMTKRIIVFPRKCEPDLFSLLQNTFQENLVILEKVSHDIVIENYQKADIMVLTSNAEGLCFPAIEAMLSGCVVIGWPCGGPEEFLIHFETALLGSFGNHIEMIQNIALLQNNEMLWRTLRANARVLAENLYTREKTKLEAYIAYHRACTYKMDY